MVRFAPREVVNWSAEQLHPLRAFAVRALEPAGLTGLLLRLWRVLILSSSSVLVVVGGLVVGVLFFLGMLAWHLGNFPVRHWPLRTVIFLAVSVAAELGTSAILITLHLERLGSRLAVRADWWSMAGQTALERVVAATVFVVMLGFAVQIARRPRGPRAR